MFKEWYIPDTLFTYLTSIIVFRVITMLTKNMSLISYGMNNASVFFLLFSALPAAMFASDLFETSRIKQTAFGVLFVYALSLTPLLPAALTLTFAALVFILCASTFFLEGEALYEAEMFIIALIVSVTALGTFNISMGELSDFSKYQKTYLAYYSYGMYADSDAEKDHEADMTISSVTYRDMSYEERLKTICRMSLYIADRLDIENPPVLYVKKNSSSRLIAGYVNGSDAIILYEDEIKNSVFLEMYEVLAHEMRHCWQSRMLTPGGSKKGATKENALSLRLKLLLGQILYPATLLSDRAYYGNYLEKDANRYGYSECDKMRLKRMDFMGRRVFRP